MTTLIECIPNFSEGENKETLSAISTAIEGIEGVQLLHQDSGKAANRTVFTFAGSIEGVFKAAYEAIKVATELIDMRSQSGKHPRIGACDVCPFVPISGITLEQLVPLVDEFAQKVAHELNVPVFLYEASASSSKRINLARHRVGEYDTLEERMNSGKWKADYGSYNAKSGGTVMGARNFLVAYNINLETKDAQIATEIAYDLRELGRPIFDKENKRSYIPGALKKVKAIGWYIKDFDKAQVSINLTDYKTTSLFNVYEQTKKLAEKYGTIATGSELIGLLPLQAILETGKQYLGDKNNASEKEIIQAAVNGLGLNELSPFEPNKRLLEYVLS